MAISPKHLEKSFQEDVTRLENKLDAVLSIQKITKGQSINLNTPQGYTTEHHALLRQRYIDAGWSDVTMESDQREGNWLKFTY